MQSHHPTSPFRDPRGPLSPGILALALCALLWPAVRPARAAFDFEQVATRAKDFASRVPQGLGYAGFRIHYPINRPDYRDEVIVFLGGSYLRAVAKDLVFGLSARGLAIDTALPSGEEFPYFKEFWLVRPAADANQMG